ncbi:hypothetical protein HAHE_19370 [Haloferula helveola]|uniref:PEP-CTERM protein-sorting domain-containing protein n=1 Tax=Haloferula helveola TaxID=490095 RepID=A0ABN6H626_9BACT|nr:hypothetical protein HAHE_19370 [Haloferula helveola]
MILSRPLALLALASATANGAIIVSTDFSGRTVSGTTASNITFSTNGIDSPGSSITVFENESNGVNDGSTQNAGLFNTTPAQGYLALDLNIDNEDGWYFDVPVVLSSGTASIAIDTLDLTFNHFSNTGAAQGNGATRSDHRAELIGSTSGVVVTDSDLNIGGAYPGGPYATSLDLPYTIDPSETWTLRIYADYNGGQGNNVGYDSFTLNGTITAVPEPSVAVLGILGVALALRRRRA